MQDEQRGGHVADVADGGVTQVGAGIGEMVRAYVAADEAGDIGAVLHGEQVVAGTLGAGGPEPAGMPDSPGSHETAVGAAENTEPAGIDPAEPLASGLHAGHHVRVVCSAPAGAWILRTFGTPDGPAPPLAVAGAAPRVAVQHAKAGGGLQLEIVDEAVAVLRERPPMHIQQRWVPLPGSCASRRYGPAFHLAAVRRPGGEPLRGGQAERLAERPSQAGQRPFHGFRGRAAGRRGWLA